MSNQLTTPEADALTRCETVIEEGKEQFVSVALALAEIRDGKLYRTSHKSFESYCRERWGFSKTHANRLIASAEVVTSPELAPIGAKLNESQARELTKLDAADRLKVLKEVVGDEPEKKITAKAIRESVEAVNKAKKKPTPEPELPEIENPVEEPKHVGCMSELDILREDVTYEAGEVEEMLKGMDAWVIQKGYCAVVAKELHHLAEQFSKLEGML